MVSVVDELAKVCEATRPAGAEDAVGGVPPEAVCRPDSVDVVSEVLRTCSQHGWSVVVRGSGSKLDWGAAPHALHVLLDTVAMDTVLEHAAGDLVVRCQAGTRFSALQDRLAAAGQQLAVDSPFPHATLGGIVATNACGPRRLHYGAVRDLLIGVTVVLSDGTVARAGSKVVKNVAGYDLGKLFTGSYGTLGVLVETIFRLHPIPASTAYVTCHAGNPDAVAGLVRRLRGAQLVPTALEAGRDARREAGREAGRWTVTVLLTGRAAGVAARAAACADLLDGTMSGEPPLGWGELPLDGADVLLRVVASPGAVGTTLRAIDDTCAGAAVRGSAGVNVFHVGVSAVADHAAVAAAVRRLRTALAPYDGSVLVLRAPAEVRRLVDPWGPVAGLDLMRRIKHEFDPAGILAPGRFVGGI